MNLLHDLIPEAVINALGWTLLHSLWQGALLAVLLSLLMLVLHRHTSLMRYRVAGGSLLLLLVASVITFFKVYEPAVTLVAFAQVQNVGSEAVFVGTTVAEETSWWAAVTDQFQGYFSQHLPLLVTVWLMGLTVMLLRLLGGLAYTRRLRTYYLKPLSLEWEQRVQALSRQIGLQKMVRIAESSLIKVPAVVGHLQPIILLPLGTAAGLSAAQLEAIIAHELAHISRHDYLLNLLQCVVESLFFFHPAVWWISDHIRAEREHCCDDLAITLCGNSLTYAYALTNLEEILMKKPVATPQLAVAFSGKKRSLLSRIKRLVQGPAVRPSFSEGFVAACVLMVGVLLFSFTAVANWGNDHGDSKDTLARFSEAALVTDLAADNDQELLQAQHITQGGQDLIIVRNKKGKIVELYVNGQKIPKGQISEYQNEIDASLNRTKNASTLKDEESVSRAMNSARSALAKVEDEDHNYHFSYDYGDGPIPPVPPLPPLPVEAIVGIATTAPLAPIPPVPPVAPAAPSSSSKDKERHKREEKAYKEEMKRYEAEMDRYEKRMEKYEEQMEKFGEEMGRYGETIGEQVGRYGEAIGEQIGRRVEVFAERVATAVERGAKGAEARTERAVELSERRAAEAERRARDHERRAEENERRAEENEKRAEENEKRAQKHEAIMDAVKSQLAKDGLVSSNSSTFSFKINEDALYVNDKKQSDALHQKYRKLVSDKNGGDMDIEMRKDGNTYSVSINE